MPNGDDEFPNEAGLQFYESLFDERHKYGLELLVTISHYETPLHLAEEYDGWLNLKLNKVSDSEGNLQIK